MGRERDSFLSWRSNYQVMSHEEPLLLSSHLPPLDFRSHHTALDWHYNFPTQENIFDDVPLLESSNQVDSVISPLDIEPINTFLSGDALCDYGEGFGIWNEMETGLMLQKEQTSLIDYHGENDNIKKENKRARKCREMSSSSKMLSRKTISQYFYMPITQAAKELNVGLTLLKKRCRELGIRRWPHRKLMSLQTLIKNVKELGKEEGEGNEVKVMNALEILEKEKKLMEERPDLQLEDKTKRLRQACFKANYKKRKLSGMVNSSIITDDGIIHGDEEEEEDDDDEDEEMKYLLSDCSFSSSSCSLII